MAQKSGAIWCRSCLCRGHTAEHCTRGVPKDTAAEPVSGPPRPGQKRKPVSPARQPGNQRFRRQDSTASSIEVARGASADSTTPKFDDTPLGPPPRHSDPVVSPDDNEELFSLLSMSEKSTTDNLPWTPVRGRGRRNSYDGAIGNRRERSFGKTVDPDLKMQCLMLTEEQIALLPCDQRFTVRRLKKRWKEEG